MTTAIILDGCQGINPNIIYGVGDPADRNPDQRAGDRPDRFAVCRVRQDVYPAKRWRIC